MVLCPVLCLDPDFSINFPDDLKQQEKLFEQDYHDLQNKQLQHFFDSFKMVCVVLNCHDFLQINV